MSSYMELAAAETYFESRMFTDDWTDASDANKTKALAHATRLIDQLNYKGDKTKSTQTNQFPRDSDTTVPTVITYACAEIALKLLEGIDPEQEAEAALLASLQMTDVKQSTITGEVAIWHISGIPSVTAWRHLLPYLRDTSLVRLERA